MGSLPISQLPQLTTISIDADIPISQNGSTYRVKGANFMTGVPHGQFVSTSTQSYTGSTTAAYVLSADTTLISSGITVVDGSKFTVDSGGTYNIQFSCQLQKTGGTNSDEYTISLWFSKNGSNLVNTCTDVVLIGTPSGSPVVMTVNIFEVLNANDYLQILWSTTSGNAVVQAIGTRTNPTRPSVPSIIVNLNQV